MLIWKLSEYIILCKWAYLFLWKYSLFRQKPQKNVKRLAYLPCYYILFDLRRPLNRGYLYNGQFFDTSYIWKVVLCSELLQILWDEFFPLEFDAVRSIYSQIFSIFRATRKRISAWQLSENFPDYKFVCVTRKFYRKFGNKYISRHQIPVEKIHLIESEGTQNKEQLFNCTKRQKTDRSKKYSQWSGLRKVIKI